MTHMGDITQRRMQAESDANGEIQAKDFRHTAAYRIVAEGLDPAVTPQMTIQSGKAIREALLRRAKAKELGLDLSYQSSKIGNVGYKHDSFYASDKERRQEELGTAEASRKRYSKKDDDTDTPRSSYRREATPGDTTTETPPVSLRDQARERFGSSPSTGSKPVRYNPFA